MGFAGFIDLPRLSYFGGVSKSHNFELLPIEAPVPTARHLAYRHQKDRLQINNLHQK
jgi:hypothetical protein